MRKSLIVLVVFVFAVVTFYSLNKTTDTHESAVLSEGVSGDRGGRGIASTAHIGAPSVHTIFGAKAKLNQQGKCQGQICYEFSGLPVVLVEGDGKKLSTEKLKYLKARNACAILTNGTHPHVKQYNWVPLNLDRGESTDGLDPQAKFVKVSRIKKTEKLVFVHCVQDSNSTKNSLEKASEAVKGHNTPSRETLQ